MSQKGLAPILIVLLIAAAVGGYLIYQNQNKVSAPSTSTSPAPTPDTSPVPNGITETANWKTYTNTALGYDIKYPLSWNLYEFKNYPYAGYPGVLDQDRVIITTFPKFPKFSPGDGSGDVYTGIDIYLGNELYTNIVDVLKRADKPDIAGNITEFKKFTINGITVYQEIRSTDEPSFKRILIPYQNKSGIIVTTYGTSQDSEDEKQILDQIISTFKFTQ